MNIIAMTWRAFLVVGVLVLLGGLEAVWAAGPDGSISSARSSPGLRLRGQEEADSRNRPVVGILTQPDNAGTEYIAASYVKFAESAGARVVPIRFWWSAKQIEATFNGLSGLLLPGGGASIDPESSLIYRAADTLVRLANEANDKGKYFPIFGHCLGWELLAIISAKNYSVLTDSGTFLDPGVCHPVHFENGGGNMFRGLDSAVKSASQSECSCYFAHEFGVTPDVFRKHHLDAQWTITSMSADMRNKAFVASAESKKYPYFAFQWHPEKTAYEWSTVLGIPHSANALALSSHISILYAQNLRKARPGTFTESEVFAKNIHQIPTTYHGDGYFMETYQFRHHATEQQPEHEQQQQQRIVVDLA